MDIPGRVRSSSEALALRLIGLAHACTVSRHCGKTASCDHWTSEQHPRFPVACFSVPQRHQMRCNDGTVGSEKSWISFYSAPSSPYFVALGCGMLILIHFSHPCNSAGGNLSRECIGKTGCGRKSVVWKKKCCRTHIRTHHKTIPTHTLSRAT